MVWPRDRWSGSRWPKILPLMTSLTKNLHPPTKKCFFECRLEDLLSLLSLWTALCRFRRQSYARAKPREIRFLARNPRTLPDAKESGPSPAGMSVGRPPILRLASWLLHNPILYLKNVPPLLVFGPSILFLAPPTAKSWHTPGKSLSITSPLINFPEVNNLSLAKLKVHSNLKS